MTNILKISTMLSLICLVGFLAISALTFYHYTFDPYSWIKQGVDKIDSHHLWVIRKDLYIALLPISAIGAVVFSLLPLAKWIGFLGKSESK